MGFVQGIKSRIGFVGNQLGDQRTDQTSSLARKQDDTVIDGQAAITIKTEQIAFADLGPEDIMRRNYAILSEVKQNPPFHDVVLNFIKSSWRILGPFAFVVFTAWEVFFYLKHFMPTDDSPTSSILLWGVTLLIEVPFMIATYDLSERKKRKFEAAEAGKEVKHKDSTGAIIAWCAMAAVNIAGQVAFMVLITGVATATGESATPLYFFIVLRVVGVLVGDAYTAFFLLPPENTISRTVKNIKAQQEGMKVLGEASMERQRDESKLRLDLQRNQNSLDRERREADFMQEFARINMNSALNNQRRFLTEQQEQEQLPPPKDERETGDL